MAQVTAISNQKGGVGKTTTAQALACGIRKRGGRVLLVDLDPQGNLSFAMGANVGDGIPSIYECMKGSAKASDVLQKTENGDIIPANLTLSGAEVEFNQIGREHILKKILAPLQDEYDHIIIDCPPALNILTGNAYTAADNIIVTMEASAYSLQGLMQLYGRISVIREFYNHDLKFAGVLICRYKGQTTIGKDLRETIGQIAEKMETRLFNTVIRESVAVQEAQFVKKNLQEYAPTSNPAEDYEQFTKEYLGE